jgi:hypothetical protein
VSTGGERFAHIDDQYRPRGIVVAPSGWTSWTTIEGITSRAPGGTKTYGHGRSYQLGGPLTIDSAGNLAWSARNSGGRAYVCVSPTDNDYEDVPICKEPGGSSAVTGLAGAPGGLIWAALNDTDHVVAVNESAELVKSVEVPAGSRPTGVAIGPEGAAWVAMFGRDAVDRIDVAGNRARFPLPAGTEPEDIALGPDGAVWIAGWGSNAIVRMTTAGIVTAAYPIPAEVAEPTSIATGPDGAIWFTEAGVGKLGRLVPDPPAPPPSPPPANPDGGSSGGGPSGGAGDGSSSADRTAPAFVGSPSFSPARFAVAGAAKARGARSAPQGSKLRFTLSENATVKVAIGRGVPGRKVGGACVAPGKAKAGAPRCTRSLAVGSLTLSGQAGPNRAPFTGKVNGRSLAPGAYSATLTARDAAGNVSAAKTAKFAIVR